MDVTNLSGPAGRIERFDRTLGAVIDTSATVSLLADGFIWTEGPTWDTRRARLLFSDIPNNRIHSWDTTNGLLTVLDPAGDDHGEKDAHAAPGTNGLFYETASDSLLVCNQNARSVDRLDLSRGARAKLAGRHDGAKLNSPNDVIRAGDGTIYFTDPPYGLREGDASDGRELSIKGVYALSPDGSLRLLVDDMTFPNGLALSPDESTLYVSQSDPNAAILRRFAVRDDGSLGGGEVWLDMTGEVGESNPGLPDGMALDSAGNVFATGPGGVFIVSPQGNVLGRIRNDVATANCAFGKSGSTLFMTATDTLLAVETAVRGTFF